MDTNEEFLFNDYFNNINLNDDLKEFYEFINNDDLTDSFKEENMLINLRYENYKRYNNIKIFELENLSEDLDIIIKEIKKIYSYILPEQILNQSIEEAHHTSKILDLIYKHLNKVYMVIEQDLKYLEQQNNDKQNKIKQIDYNNVDRKILNEILEKYNDIVLYNSIIDDNIFDNYRRQIKRKNDLNKLYRLINLEIDDYNSFSQEIDNLNKEISRKIEQTYTTISYLEDLLTEKSKYKYEFLTFKDYFNNLIAYDDSNYSDVISVYDALYKDMRLTNLLNYFEESFIKEREEIIKEENFVFEKYGIKNIRTSLDYISANYIDILNQTTKEKITDLYKKINEKDYILEELYKSLKEISDNIWKISLTDIYDYRYNSEFCFICTNNEFIDEKHQAILITDKMLRRVDDYSEYEIGFICLYNDNILYVTENEDIMTVDYNDMSNLKTPKQIEQEFLNFRVSNRIALNGYTTKFSAVYMIEDDNIVKYTKALNLANQYNLPLIILKKDKN